MYIQGPYKYIMLLSPELWLDIFHVFLMASIRRSGHGG